MFYVFFDSVLVCGAPFGTAFHEDREASRTSSKSHRSPEESKEHSSKIGRNMAPEGSTKTQQEPREELLK